MLGLFRKIIRGIGRAYVATVVELFARTSVLRKLATNILIKTRDYLSDEAFDTKVMVEVYSRFLQGRATREQISEANTQFFDLIKNLGLGVVVVLPFSFLTLPLLFKLSKRLGIDILPSPSLRKKSGFQSI